MEDSFGPGPIETKIRNTSGAKNSQLGLRVRDAKKAAWASGPQKHLQTLAKGPIANILKDNTHSSSSKGGVGCSGKEDARVEQENIVEKLKTMYGIEAKVLKKKIRDLKFSP